MNVNISTYCTVSNHLVKVNGTEYFEGAPDEPNFLKALYQKLEMSYPKFFKMDDLSKLGVLGVELLKLHNPEISNYLDDEIGLVFQTSKGCISSDLSHQEKVNKKSPSPSIFVYTLANIVIGEISIKNKWFGESILFIAEENDTSSTINYLKSLILTNKSKCCILGIIDAYDNKTELKMALITKQELGIALNEQNLKAIFEK